jgi:CheY-like chemotaxis protein
VFSRKGVSKLEPLDLNEEVVQVSRMLERMIPKMIHIDMHLAANLKTMNADAAQVEQIMMNLGVNARDAMPDGGNLIFTTGNVTLDEEDCKEHFEATPGEYVMLSVSDSGQGMDKEVLDHMFEPFFTTKEPGKGTGLGLAMVYGIVKSHGGFIMCKSNFQRGTTFKIYFPVAKIEKKKEVEIAEKLPVKGGHETILLVDDEKPILSLGKEILTSFGYRVLTAPDGEEALKLYKQHERAIDLVILDLIMPGMGGRRCMEALLKVNPGIKMIVASGHSNDPHAQEVIEKWSRGFIQKPYEVEVMLNVIRDVFERDGGPQQAAGMTS